MNTGELSGPVILGRDHHDVSGTDSPFRETSNIYDGSKFTADMAIHNVIGDSFRGATWVSIHNGGGSRLGRSNERRIWNALRRKRRSRSQTKEHALL